MNPSLLQRFELGLPCHGAAGHGDGPAAEHVDTKPSDEDARWHVILHLRTLMLPLQASRPATRPSTQPATRPSGLRSISEMFGPLDRSLAISLPALYKGDNT